MKNSIIFLLLLVFVSIDAQKKERDSVLANTYPKFNAKNLIIPGITIGYGLLALNSPTLIDINENIHESLVGDREVGVDDFTLYIPALSVFAIDLFSHNARHRLGDRTAILVLAAAMANGTTFGLKAITNEERPYGGKFNSFPSGHTVNSFVGAEFLRQEFKHESIWYGVAGYTMAFTTAYLRMYNNQHWFSDVVAAAGLGILSTQAAYWIYPWLKYKVFKCNDKNGNGLVYPSINKDEIQLGLIWQF